MRRFGVVAATIALALASESAASVVVCRPPSPGTWSPERQTFVVQPDSWVSVAGGDPLPLAGEIVIRERNPCDVLWLWHARVERVALTTPGISWSSPETIYIDGLPFHPRLAALFYDWVDRDPGAGRPSGIAYGGSFELERVLEPIDAQTGRVSVIEANASLEGYSELEFSDPRGVLPVRIALDLELVRDTLLCSTAGPGWGCSIEHSEVVGSARLVATVPEPSSAVQACIALGVCAGLARRRQALVHESSRRTSAA